MFGHFWGFILVQKKKIPPPASSKLSEHPLAWVLSRLRNLLRGGNHLVERGASSLGCFRRNLSSTYQNRFVKGINMEYFYAAAPDQNL